MKLKNIKLKKFEAKKVKVKEVEAKKNKVKEVEAKKHKVKACINFEIKRKLKQSILMPPGAGTLFEGMWNKKFA